MPERGFKTEFWTDEFVQELPVAAKCLYVYLWTNARCNQAGLYKIGIQTIANETGIAAAEIPELLRKLEPKVFWDSDQNLIWVKNFVKHQCKSPSFLAAVASRLQEYDNGMIQQVIDYNWQKYNITIPFDHSGGSVYPQWGHSGGSVGTQWVHTTDTDTDTGTGTKSKAGLGDKGVVKGEKGKTRTGKTLASESEIEESLSSGDREVISVWHSVKGFRMEPSAAAELVARLRTEFPDVDILATSKAWAARKLSEPLTQTSRPSGQLYNFMAKAHQWAQEKRDQPQGGKGSRPPLPGKYRGQNADP